MRTRQCFNACSCDAWCSPQQDILRRLKLSSRLHGLLWTSLSKPVVGHPFCNSDQALHLFVRSDIIVCNQCSRMRHLRFLTPLQIDDQICLINLHNLACPASCARIINITRAINRVILKRKCVTINERPWRFLNNAQADQPTERVLIFNQLIIGEVTKTVVFPPHRLVFSAIPLEHLRQEPICSLLICPFTLFLRQPGGEALLQNRYLSKFGFEVFACSTRFKLRPSDRTAKLCFKLTAQRLEPLAQPPGRNAVVAIVVSDGLQDLFPGCPRLLSVSPLRRVSASPLPRVSP